MIGSLDSSTLPKVNATARRCGWGWSGSSLLATRNRSLRDLDPGAPLPIYWPHEESRRTHWGLLHHAICIGTIPRPFRLTGFVVTIPINQSPGRRSSSRPPKRRRTESPLWPYDNSKNGGHWSMLRGELSPLPCWRMVQGGVPCTKLGVCWSRSVGSASVFLHPSGDCGLEDVTANPSPSHRTTSSSTWAIGIAPDTISILPSPN